MPFCVQDIVVFFYNNLAYVTSTSFIIAENCCAVKLLSLPVTLLHYNFLDLCFEQVSHLNMNASQKSQSPGKPLDLSCGARRSPAGAAAAANSRTGAEVVMVSTHVSSFLFNQDIFRSAETYTFYHLFKKNWIVYQITWNSKTKSQILIQFNVYVFFHKGVKMF